MDSAGSSARSPAALRGEAAALIWGHKRVFHDRMASAGDRCPLAGAPLSIDTDGIGVGFTWGLPAVR